MSLDYFLWVLTWDSENGKFIHLLRQRLKSGASNQDMTLHLLLVRRVNLKLFRLRKLGRNLLWNP